MKTITLAILSLPFLATPVALSQSAEGFDTAGLAPSGGNTGAAAMTAEKKAEPAVSEAPAVLKMPSRYAGGGSDLAAYINTYSARFSIKKRQTDPFGRNQDPDFRVPEPKIVSSSSPKQSYKPAPPTPFINVVSAIEINTVDLAKQRFLVGTREFRKGSVIPVRLPNGKAMKVQVLSVSSTVIAFRNLETGETANRKLEMLPEGMRKGMGPIATPGMQSTSSDAPLEIQPSPPPLSSN